MTIKLLQALTEGNDSIVVATAADLKEFALTILSEASIRRIIVRRQRIALVIKENGFYLMAIFRPELM